MTDPINSNVVQWLECACTSAECSVRFSLDRGTLEDDPEIYVSTCLASRFNFWERLVIGLKYIFVGFSRKTFAETILEHGELEKLSRLLHIYFMIHKLRIGMRKQKQELEDDS